MGNLLDTSLNGIPVVRYRSTFFVCLPDSGIGLTITRATRFYGRTVSLSFRLLPWISSALQDVSWPKKHHRPERWTLIMLGMVRLFRELMSASSNASSVVASYPFSGPKTSPSRSKRQLLISLKGPSRMPRSVL